MGENRIIRRVKLLLIISLSIFVFEGSAKALFQENLWGARPAGLAGAYTALADDSNSPAYNPAGISLVPDDELTLMYAQLYTGVDLHVGEETSELGLGYFSYVPQIKNKKYGSYAISWTNFVASNLLREDSFSLTFADSYVMEKFTNAPIFSYGANLKFLRRSFSTDSRTAQDPVFKSGRDSNAVTGDIGLMLRPNLKVLPGLKFGFSAQNITEPDMGLAATDRVPARLAVGVAYQEKSLRIFNPAIDLARRNGRTVVALANESWFAKDTFALRLGYSPDQMGGGVGYQFHVFNEAMMRLDYSLLIPIQVEGTNGSHRLSITLNF